MAECIAPGTFSDEALAAYAMNPDGADLTLKQHVAQCAACQQEVTQLGALLHLMDERLYRLDCPPVEYLDAYVALEISEAETHEIVAHLRDCLHCQKEVEVFRREVAGPLLLAGERMPLFATQRRTPAPSVQRIEGAEPSSNEGMIVRGTGLPPLTYTIGEFELTLQPAFEEAGQVRLFGTFVGTNIPDAFPPAVRLFDLAGDDLDLSPQPVAEAVVEDEEFILGPVPYGRYQIEVLLPDRVFVVGTALGLVPPDEP
ncbi:MAG TPA: hypothetical protein VH593_29615 [Ktedonobacteraceae bacterium]